MSMLFNLLVMHEHTAADLLKSTILSIPKENLVLINRDISLFNLMCKLFDNEFFLSIEQKSNTIFPYVYISSLSCDIEVGLQGSSLYYVLYSCIFVNIIIY